MSEGPPNPSVSLLVPTFNREDLLGACLDSALAQTMTDLEVVVVDGASTDGTWEVCRRYAAADSRIRIFRDGTNTGPVRGWWRCLEEARGRFATFLWSDDLIMPTFLERTLPFLSHADIAFAYTAAEIGPRPGEGVVDYDRPPNEMTSEAFILGSLAPAGGFPVSPACGLFRLDDLKSSFTSQVPTDPPLDLTATGAGTDLLLYLRTAARRPRVAHIPEPLAFFRTHEGSITVHGRSGAVALGYAVTKAWFAETYGRPDLARTILGRQWLVDMRSRRRLITPGAAVKRYGRLVSRWDLVRSGATFGITRAIAGRKRIP
jgi:glycosyltransferase involved in cell wall biosynthesis